MPVHYEELVFSVQLWLPAKHLSGYKTAMFLNTTNIQLPEVATKALVVKHFFRLALTHKDIFLISNY